MAKPDTHPDRRHERGESPTPTTLVHDRGIIGRWRRRHARRRLERLLRPHKRRALARSLRGAAKEATERGSCLHSSVLLRYRAAAVRRELLEIAALLEQVRDPDPACVKAVRELLVNGDSPLYHPGVHVSELYAALYYIRAGLVPNHRDDKSIEGAAVGAVPDERTKL